jgi:hypothetical protein
MTEGRLGLDLAFSLQTPSPIASAPAAEDGFVHVQGGEREQVSASTTVVTAYLLIWIIMFVFVFLSVRKMRALSLLADRLAAALTKRGS